MRPRWAPLSLVAAIVVVLVADGVTLAARRDASVTPAGSSTEPATGPSGRRSAELQRALPELQAFVEQARGLAFRRPPQVELLSDGQFEALLQQSDSVTPGTADPVDPAEEAAFIRFLQALGLLDGDVDFDEVAETELDSIVGFYDSKRKALYVRGAELTPYVRDVIVHELTHALDDQHFELDRPTLGEEEGGDEAATAFQALVEGSAMVVERRWFDSRDATERAAIAAIDDAGARDRDVPALFAALSAFPYVVGPRFVQAVLDAGGPARLAEAFARPPVTTEQILHPARFLAGEGPKRVARPEPDGRAIGRGVLGELGLQLMLDRAVDHGVAVRAAAGWGADSYVAWMDRAGRTCVRTNVVMDTATDTAELLSALWTWAARNPGASVRGSTTIIVTNCR